MKTELQAAYNALLIRARQIEIADKNRTVKCVHCGQDKSHHPDHDPRCSTSSLSRKFKSVSEEELARIDAALPPIEAILAHL